ncbi:MAG TPA: cobalamin biosynthesis protein CbiL [Paenirhodobacter sp.]
MKRLACAVLSMCLMLASPALAHKLRLFATVEGDAVTGYAFFVGGGRAQGADWWATDAEGARIAQGQTDAQGRYRFIPPPPITDDLTVHIDTHEGHMVQARIAPERFDAGPTQVPAPPVGASLAPGGAVTAVPHADPDALAIVVRQAVQHEVEPLLERIEQMDARMRLTDIMSGLFLIIGLAGAALYIHGRKR